MQINSDLLRIVDSISRDRNIEKDIVFADLETAMVSAARKAFGETEEVNVTIDRITGQITADMQGQPISMKDLGRIAAQTAKQVMIQKIREAERVSIFEEYKDRRGQIVTGTVSRFEGGALVVMIGRAEGFLPRSEQVPGESHHPGERVRCMILDVREVPNQVKIVLTRTHPDFIRRLFELEVPEVAERIIEMKALAREAGYRTKIAVSSIDSKVDAVGACVGVRGSRIKNIVEELSGEKIDIVRWNESSQILIGNALKPAEVQEIALCFELGRATVVVAEDQLSLAIGKRGQNVRLAARLTGWDIDILTPAEYNKSLGDMEEVLKGIDGVDDVMLDKFMAMGLISLMDIEEVGVDPLVEEMEVEGELAERIVTKAGEEAKRLAEEAEAAKAKEAEEAKRKAAAEEAGEEKAAGADGGAGGAGAAEEGESVEVLESGEASPAGESAPEAGGESQPVDADGLEVADGSDSTGEEGTSDSLAAEDATAEEASSEVESGSAVDEATETRAASESDAPAE